MKHWLFFIAGLLLAGCSLSKNPVGMPLKDDLSQDLTATWVNPKGELDIVCDATGKLVVTMKEADEETKEVETETLSGILLTMDEDFYVLNLKEDKPDSKGYTFCLASLDDDEAIAVWLPDGDLLKDLVKSGKLKGETSKYSATLTDDGEKIAKILAEIGLSEAFTWERPMMFWRMEN